MKKSCGLIAIFLILSGLVFADALSPSDPLLDHLIGRWILSGTIAGKKTTHDVSAEWVLNHGYVRLHEMAREKNTTGAPAYEAIIFVSSEAPSKNYTCLWLDSTGSGGISAQAIGRAKRKANSIPFIFKDPKGRVSFENTLSYDSAADTWTWIMDNVEKGKREPFGRVRLVKR